MSTAPQLAANQANAQQSTGPKTEEGKFISSQNNFHHGLAGRFKVLSCESQAEFELLVGGLRAEYRPNTPTETLLVERMAQHHWLSRRALISQDLCFKPEVIGNIQKELSLFMRYQVTHDRAFHRCLNDLLRLRAERRRAEIGFESQQVKQAAEFRKQEMHEARLKALNSRTLEREIDNDIRQTVEAPLPGHMRIPFDALRDAFKLAMHDVSDKLRAEKAA